MVHILEENELKVNNFDNILIYFSSNLSNESAIVKTTHHLTVNLLLFSHFLTIN